jgi:hypothetical protein
MANEAQFRDRISNAIDFTWFADTTSALKGTILRLSGARTVAPATADNHAPIGILGRDKIVGDGRLQVPVYIDGIFDCYFDGVAIPAVTVGSHVAISGANILKGYTTLDDEAGYVLGRALEAVTVAGYYQVLVGYS